MDNPRYDKWTLAEGFLTYQGRKRCWSLGFPSYNRADGCGQVSLFSFYWWPTNAR